MTDEQIMTLWRECSIPTDANDHTTGPLPFARAVLALTSAPAEPQNAQTHLEDIYAYLCSIAPTGIADEAFRNVPETILAASVRNRIAQSRPEVGAESSPVHGHAGAARSGKPVAAPAETPQAAGAIDAREQGITPREQSLIARIRAECDHAGINDMRLTARFGQTEGPIAVRESSLLATIEGWQREHGLLADPSNWDVRGWCDLCDTQEHDESDCAIAKNIKAGGVCSVIYGVIQVGDRTPYPLLMDSEGYKARAFVKEHGGRIVEYRAVPTSPEEAPPAAGAAQAVAQACDLLSMSIGILMGAKQKIGYVDRSPIARLIAEAVEFLRPWPEKMPTALAATPAPEDGEAKGILIAARFIEERRENFDHEHCTIDPETGAAEYGRGAKAQAAEDYSTALAELADDLRSLAAQPKDTK